MEGLIATGYYVAGFAGRSGGCQNGVFFSLISACMCRKRHIPGRAAHCSRSGYKIKLTFTGGFK